ARARRGRLRAGLLLGVVRRPGRDPARGELRARARPARARRGARRAMSDDGGEQFQLLRSAQFDWAQTLAMALEDEGIEFRVMPGDENKKPKEPQCAVYVLPADLERARAIDRDVMLELFPDLPDDFDPGQLDTSRCPACQESVPEGAASCPECGL